MLFIQREVNTKKLKIFLFLTILLLSLTVCSCGKQEISDISKTLNIKIKDASIVESFDNHGGFHGDGIEFILMETANEKTIKEIKSEWHKLPLSENLTALLYGVQSTTGSYITQIGPYITKNGEAVFPKIENGYYYFYDKNNESTNSFDDSSVLTRPSFNVIISIFDTDTNKLYYCEFDT